MSGIVQTSLNMYIKKNGSQHAIKEPIMSPRIKVALFSFFLAIRLFSLSGSLGFCTRGTTCSTTGLLSAPLLSPLLPDFFSSVRRFFECLARPNIGLHNRNFNGFTAVHWATTPLSELLGSNSLTMSVSMPMEGCRALAKAAACCCNSPFTDNVEPRNWHADSVLGLGDWVKTCKN